MRDQPQTIINEGAKMVAEKSKEFNPIEDAQRDCDLAPTAPPAQKLMLETWRIVWQPTLLRAADQRPPLFPGV